MKHPLHDILIAIAEGKPVQYNRYGEWIDLDPSKSFILRTKDAKMWRIKPKEKVNKWRWVVKSHATGALSVTNGYYPEPGWVENPNYVNVQKVDSSMIEAEE